MNKKVDSIINKIIKEEEREIDKRGLFECAGYRKYNKFTDEISELQLSYQEECLAKDKFNRACDGLNDKYSR